MADNLGQKFVVDILTKYRDEGLRQAQEAQTKLKEVLAASAGAFGNAQTAAGKYEGGLKNLFNGLERLNKLSWQGVAVGSTVSRVFTGIAGEAVRATARVAAFGEELYYMNRRLSQPGTGGLFNFAFAAQQIGLSPEQGLGAIESMGAAVRTNPGIAALLSRFLPGYKGGAVGGQEQLGLVNSLKGRFGEQGYFVASQFAQEFGLGEHEFRQMWTNIDDLNEQYKTHGERLKAFGVNTNETSKSFRDFHVALTNVIDILEIQATRIGSWLADKFGTPFLKTTGMLLQEQPSTTAVAASLLTRAVRGARSLFGGGEEPAGAPVAGSSGTAKEAAIQRFMAMGLSREAAIGAATGLQGESGQNISPTSVNPSSGAYGIANWLGQRKRNFAAMFGHPIEQSTAEEQWQFLSAELQGKGGDPQTAEAFKLLKNPNITAGQATNIWENMVERHGDAAYTSKLALQAQSYSGAAPSGGVTYDVDHNVTVNINGNADKSVMMDAASLLGKDSVWEQQTRQMIRGANFR